MKRIIKLSLIAVAILFLAYRIGVYILDTNNANFTCIHEQFPPLPQEVQPLYLYANYHDLHNRWDVKPGVLESLLPYYRIAAAYGHYQANLRLQDILLEKDDERKSLIPGGWVEALDLNEALIQILPATAYYRFSGVLSFYTKNSASDADRFFAKAIELGNAAAQYSMSRGVIESVSNESQREAKLALSDKYLKCAAEQKHGEATQRWAIANMGFALNNLPEATRSAYLGTIGGGASAAYALFTGFFKETSTDDNERYLGYAPDDERARRLQIIAQYLSYNAHLLPEINVADLEQIVPLPPAKLPPWDGKIAFQRWYEGPAPAKPTDELMQQLAKARELDWKTGLPLKDDDTPAKPKVHKGFF